jgi:hypothetical protein
MIIGPEWPPEYYTLTIEDFIYSMLLDSPDMYLVTPGRTSAYVFIIDVGMVRVVHDFRNMSPGEIAVFVNLVRNTF